MLNKAKEVYSAVVCPAMIYEASIWHMLKISCKRKNAGPIAKLVTIQNKCLRLITGAYKATNIKVLEAESGVISLNLHLDQIVLRSRAILRCSKTIELAKARIKRKVKGKRGRKRQPEATLMSIKD